MPEVLNVQVRTAVGRNATKKVRKAGQVPAVLYGHGQESVSLSVPAEEFLALLRRGSRLVELKGAVSDTALLRGTQWDPLGKAVIHFDLVRVSATEAVRITLPIELRGSAPGVREGGVIVHVAHDIDIECPASAIPERVGVSLNNLVLGSSIKMAEVELPAEAKLLSDPEQIVVQCVAPLEMPDEAAAAAVPGEPEIIGRKADEEGEEEKE